jgi:UDP-N-acetyl-2-amino-2-deoxyglucuronate dehydrogenase
VKNFALIGIAGYIAPRHLKAIKDTGGRLAAAVDPHDSVSILDQFFPEANYFSEFERFERFIEKTVRTSPENRIDYISICSPNYLHDTHIRFALRAGANAICEKPLVLNTWNLDLLEKIEEETKLKIYTIMQLRLHPAIVKLKKEIQNSTTKIKHRVELKYITSRGSWYDYSWKGIEEKSGGLATNIGIHLFDLILWLFGGMIESKVEIAEKRRMSGFIELENAYVNWFLSIENKDLPEPVIKKGKTAYRSITIDNKEIEFTEGFSDLHTRSYEEILKGNGFGIKDARQSLELVQRIKSEG